MASKLLEQLRGAIRARNYSIRTEQAYVGWVVRFIRFHGTRHPAEMGDAEVVAFLTHLAVNREVSASTQNQALSALLFLYANVICRPIGDITQSVRAKRPRKLPTVLSREEVRAILAELEGIHKLVGAVLYGSGFYMPVILRVASVRSTCRRRWRASSSRPPGAGPGNMCGRHLA